MTIKEYENLKYKDQIKIDKKYQNYCNKIWEKYGVEIVEPKNFNDWLLIYK